MSDPIKIFIRHHRQAFDLALPDVHLWKGVEKALQRLPEADGLERYLLGNRILLDSAEVPAKVWSGIESRLDAALRASQGDPLEQFIRQHREAFDREIPGEEVWCTIAPVSPEKTDRQSSGAPIVSFSLGRTLLRAAAAVMLLLTGAGLGIWYAGQNNRAAQGLTLSEVSPEYAELERYYQSDIAVKKEKLAAFAGYRDEEVFNDLQQMDKITEELQRELADVPPDNREKVVRAMIENYKAKAAILQRVLEHVQNSTLNQSNSNNNEIENI
jgi:hypothetical protein